MVKYFLNFLKDINLQIQEAQRTPSSINSKEITSRYISDQPLKTTEKKKKKNGKAEAARDYIQKLDLPLTSHQEWEAKRQ